MPQHTLRAAVRSNTVFAAKRAACCPRAAPPAEEREAFCGNASTRPQAQPANQQGETPTTVR